MRTKGSGGQGITEYLVIAVVVGIVVLVGVRYFGSSAKEKFETATEELSDLKEGSTSVSFEPQSTAPERLAPVENAPPAKESAGGTAGNVQLPSDLSGLKASPIGDNPEDMLPQFAWRDFLFIAGGVVLVGVLIVFLGTRDKEKKKKRGKKRRAKGKSETGQAMVEFVVIAITFLFTILGVIQLGMILNAYALVRYAAYNAARAAIVHGGDQEKMEEAARLSLVSIFPRHGRAHHVLGLTENYLAAKATDDSVLFYSYLVNVNGVPMPRAFKITDVKILNNRGVSSGEVVTFDDPAQAPKGLVTVQVTHHYQLVIPLVNRILFYVYNQFLMKKDFGLGGYDGESVIKLSADTDRLRRTGGMGGVLGGTTEYRYPLTAHYTMRLMSDYERP